MNILRHVAGTKVRAAAFSALGLVMLTTQAQALNYSPDCRNYQAVPVAAPQNAILFAKQPVPHPAGNATVYNIDDDENIVIPAGHNSCVYAVAPPSNNSYCFIARDDNTILTVGAGAIQDPGGLTPCQ